MCKLIKFEVLVFGFLFAFAVVVLKLRRDSSSGNGIKIGTKIICVGRNYAAHAKELGNAVPKVISPSPTKA